MRKIFLLIYFILATIVVEAAYIIIPMDNAQKNHLKAYGIAYWILKNDLDVSWLLNYRGGSFLTKHIKQIENECVIRGVSYEVIADVQSTQILMEISNPEVNMDIVKLEKAPRMAVYSPKDKRPWDDAVTLVLNYAEIPYDVIYDEEVLQGVLPLYDWLHMHHEDFTGQYGKFFSSSNNLPWYRDYVKSNEVIAKKLGFNKVSELKLAVAKKISDYTVGGGFLFAMCAATDSYDIALAAENIDICDVMFDGDPTDQNAQSKLDFSKSYAFRNYELSRNSYEYEFSNIDATPLHSRTPENLDYFTLFDFSAKWDVIPTMLCQDHEKIIKGFMGQTTAYNKQFIKPEVLVMGETKSLNTARYIHGEYGKGTWTFYGGHDPEDYRHYVLDPPTDLSLHPNSPGYRLILNNVLFPAARKKKQKT